MHTVKTPFQRRITIRRSTCHNVTVIELSGPLGNMMLKIRARLGARQRRALGLTFLRQIRPWLKYFSSQTLHHPEHVFYNFRRDSGRGIPLFSGYPIDRKTGQIGFRIRMRRLELGYTQRELASWAGIHSTYLSDLEQGLHRMRKSTRLKLERALGIPLTEIVESPSREGARPKSA